MYPFMSRPLWRVFIVTGLLLSSGCRPRPTEESGPVRIVSWGGNLQDQLVTNWIAPAAGSDSIRYEVETWDGDMGALAVRIRRGINTWDLVHVEAQDAFRPDRAELFQAFPQGRVGSLQNRVRAKGIVREGIGLPVMQWAYVLTYRNDKLQIDTMSRPDWKALWDVQRYPGTRGIRDWPVGIIEIALVAMNRNVDSVLYAPNLTRAELETQVNDALEYLGRIAEQTVWWETGDQLQRGVASGEFVLATGYSGRVGFEARKLCPDNPVRRDCPIQVNPRTAIVATDWWVIPKNARHKAAARKLLEAMYTDRSALEGARSFAVALGYRVPIEGQTVNDPIGPFLDIGSSANPTVMLSIDEGFWSQNFNWINDRWRLWRSRS